MEQPTHISLSEEQFNLLMGKMCVMQKRLDDFAAMKNLLHQVLASFIGFKKVTKTTILEIINDGRKSEKLSAINPKQEKIAPVRKRNALKNVQKAAKQHRKSSFSKL